jgi:hypothetical protein
MIVGHRQRGRKRMARKGEFETAYCITVYDRFCLSRPPEAERREYCATRSSATIYVKPGE